MHFNTAFGKNIMWHLASFPLLGPVRSPSQTDMIIMDFSKAFDKVPHRRLQYKLNWYGIRGSTHTCIQNCPQRRLQKVVSEVSQSSTHPVLSGVPPRYCSWPHTIFDIHQRPPRRSHQWYNPSLCWWLHPLPQHQNRTLFHPFAKWPW